MLIKTNSELKFYELLKKLFFCAVSVHARAFHGTLTPDNKEKTLHNFNGTLHMLTGYKYCRNIDNFKFPALLWPMCKILTHM